MAALDRWMVTTQLAGKERLNGDARPLDGDDTARWQGGSEGLNGDARPLDDDDTALWQRVRSRRST